MTAPLNCPHCGGNSTTIHQVFAPSEDDNDRFTKGHDVYVECDTCLSRGPWAWLNSEFYSFSQREEKAVEEWNRRA